MGKDILRSLFLDLGALLNLILRLLHYCVRRVHRRLDRDIGGVAVVRGVIGDDLDEGAIGLTPPHCSGPVLPHGIVVFVAALAVVVGAALERGEAGVGGGYHRSSRWGVNLLRKGFIVIGKFQL